MNGEHGGQKVSEISEVSEVSEGLLLIRGNARKFMGVGHKFEFFLELPSFSPSEKEKTDIQVQLGSDKRSDIRFHWRTRSRKEKGSVATLAIYISMPS